MIDHDMKALFKLSYIGQQKWARKKENQWMRQ
jgi:hypothetical protein